MKNYLLSALLFFASLYVNAQIIGSGYYRVMNQRTNRYVYIEDCEAEISRNEVDMSSVELWKKESKNYLIDPASVIYFDQHSTSGNSYTGDLQAQGTGIYALSKHLVSIYQFGTAANPYYQLYAQEKGSNVYLGDEETSTANQGVMGTNSSSNYRNWKVYPINNVDNYIAINPQTQVDGKYYSSYFVSFPFSFYSSGMKAYYVSEVDYDNAIAVMKEINGDIPSATPVIVESLNKDITNNIISPSMNKPSMIDNNVMEGVYFCNENRLDSKTAKTPYDKNTMRILGVTSEGKLGFVTATSDMLSYVYDNAYVSYDYIQCVKANTSYLKVSDKSPSEFTVMTEEEYSEFLASQIKPGDVNGDGSVGAPDLQLLVNSVLGKGTPDVFVFKVADIDGDGKLTSADIMRLVNIILGK